MLAPFTVLDPDYTIEELIAYVEERYATLETLDAVERFGLIGKYLFTAVGLDFDHVAGNAAQIIHNDGPEREVCMEATIRFCAKFSVYIMAQWNTDRAQARAQEMMSVAPPFAPPPAPRPRRRRRRDDADR